MEGIQFTFFCELKPESLEGLFSDPAVIRTLVEMNACLSLGILDLSPARAAVVQRLNDAGVPLTAWLLLPAEQGYWFNLDNVTQAHRMYEDFGRWTREHGLHWGRIGLDIEPDIREMAAALQAPQQLLSPAIRRLFDARRLWRGRQGYLALLARIRDDGYPVESYQLPFLVDDRAAGSTILQRLLGILDLPVEREVLMLYSSFFRPYGEQALRSYGPQALAIGVGVTGGGVDLGRLTAAAPLSWGELRRDICLAARWTRHVYIFSLEGCVEQGFLCRLKERMKIEADNVAFIDAGGATAVRRLVQGLLWLAERPYLAPAVVLGLRAMARRMGAWRGK